MNVRYSYNLIAGVIHAQAALEIPPSEGPAAVTPVEQQLMQSYGELSVDAGGTLTPATGSPVVLPQRIVYIPSQMPVRQAFALADYESRTEELAGLWLEDMKTKIDDAVVTLLAKEIDVAYTEIAKHPIPA